MLRGASGPIGSEPGAREGAECDYVRVLGRAIHRWKALDELFKSHPSFLHLTLNRNALKLPKHERSTSHSVAIRIKSIEAEMNSRRNLTAE